MKAKKPIISLGVIAIVAIMALSLFSAGGTVPAFAAPVSQANATATPTSGAVISPPVNVQTGALAQFQSQLVQLYEQVSPSVVSINILGTPSSASGFPQGQGQSQGQSQGQQGDIVPLGAGSGVVWDNQGNIVTNNHVVESAQQLEVIFNDGTSASATVVGTDPSSDLAVIRVNDAVAQLHPINLGFMDNVQVGDLTVAMGNPFGLQGSMSLGIVSALGRSLPVGSGQSSYTIPSIIQTDAPINPGNSGGALVNISGELIGIPSAIESTSGSGSGVGFAIPISIVKRVVPALIQTGQYQQPYLGITGATLTNSIAQQMGLPASQQGALVIDVAPGGPAAQAGIQGGSQTTTINGQQIPIGGDVITAINGAKITRMDDLISYLTLNASVGDTVTLTILRNGQSTTETVTLAARPAVPQTGQGQQGQGPTPQPGAVQLGVQVAPVDSQLIQQFNLPAGTQGLFVGAVLPGYPAAQAGLQPGDVITAFNGNTVTSINELRDLLDQVQPGGSATMTVLRNGQTQQLTVNFGQAQQPTQQAPTQSAPTQSAPTATPNLPATATPTPFNALPQGPTATPFTNATNTPMPVLPLLPTNTPMAPATSTPVFLPTNTPSGQAAGGQSLQQSLQQSLLGFDAYVVNSDTAAVTLALPANMRGIYVNSVLPGSVAANSQLQVGDVITAVNGQQVYSLQDLGQLVQATLLGQPITLTVLRDGQVVQLPLNLGF